MSSPKDVPFLSETPARHGFESTPPAMLTDRQKVRATDLFLRGAITPEQWEQAHKTVGGFEAIIGRSNLLPAVFLEQGAATARATCLIRTSGIDFRGRSGAWTGTAFLLSNHILVTNNHVLNSPAVANAGTAVFDYQVGTDYQPRPTRSFRLRPDRLFLTSPAIGGLDYTFCWVDGEPGREFGVVRADRQAFSILEREFANVVSHPNGRMKEISLQENEVVWQDDVVVHYTSDTEPGSSGAAVCTNTWQLVALHHASKASNVPDFPLLNEGIKLSAIAADLERLSLGSGATARTAAELLRLFDGSDERLGFFGALGRPQPTGSGFEAVVNTFKGTEHDLDVGFWNVEWLSNRYAQKKAAVAKVMHELNLDVWCLFESSPNAAAEVTAELETTYGLKFAHVAAEPNAPDGKQSCTVLWNTATVDVTDEAWGEPIETWLQARSTEFDDLGLGGFEAVHGKIFDRYPALFHVTSKKPVPGGQPLDFYLVPLHLKAKSEGSLRRRMASKILAEAVKKKIEGGADADFILGGDANAPLDTDDFANMISAGLTAASATDAANGAFSYLKGPKSLIDHIFLSPNLSLQYGTEDFFVVAAEKQFPKFITQISDHRPILLRMSLGDGDTETSALTSGFDSVQKTDEALTELKARLNASGFDPEPEGNEYESGFEAKKKKKKPASRGGNGARNLSGRTGYDPTFLGSGFTVPLPGLPSGPEATPVVVNKSAPGIDRFVLPYTHFSVVMNGDRRMPFYSAVNIDGKQLRKIPRGDRWFLDPRIPADVQADDSVYSNNDLDRGHMTRRLDPVWGSVETASQADADTFCFTNACPQHKNLNQKEWAHLEDYVLNSARAHDLLVCVLTGPVLRPSDRPYRGVKLPQEFWKVVAIRRADTSKLSVTGYLLSQKDMITGFEFVFGQFKTYQVKLALIAEMTGLSFGGLLNFDPLAGGGFESAVPTAVEIAGPESLVL